MRYSSISAIGDFTALSPAASDWLRLDPARCSGGQDASLRTTVEDAPGADGVLIEPPLDGAQILTLAGDLIITSDGSESGYFAALDTLLGSLKSALDAMKTAPDDLVHSAGTLSVWKYAPLDSSMQGTLMSVTFGLVVDTAS